MNALTRQLPESQWKDDKILDAAAGPVAAFEKRVTKKSEDMGQHVEEEIPRGFKIPKTVADNWDLALKVAMVVDACATMDKRVEIILATYLNSASEVPDKSRLQLFHDNYEEDKKS